MHKPDTEEYFQWRIHADDGSGQKRLLILHADPYVHEYPFDFYFKTIKEALKAKAEHGYAHEENWVLVSVRIEPVAVCVQGLNSHTDPEDIDDPEEAHLKLRIFKEEMRTTEERVEDGVRVFYGGEEADIT